MIMKNLGFALHELSLGLTASALPKVAHGAELCVRVEGFAGALDRPQEKWA